jgi:hypothetical protein
MISVERAGKRDAMRSGRVVSRRDFVQPRAGNVLSQFVGAGEGNEFKVLHSLIFKRNPWNPKSFLGFLFEREL